MAQNWTINPKTGDYVMQGGSPVQTSDLYTPAYIRLKVPRTRWLYAPNSKYGSDFWQLRKRQTGRDVSNVEITAGRALQPIADDGRAASISVTFTEVVRGAVAIQTSIKQANGQIIQFTIPSVGA